jgi:hypothetical protein
MVMVIQKLTITFNTGTATARAALSPKGGFGANAINDLRAKALMFNSKPSLVMNLDTFITDNDFRQVSLIKNPTITATDSDFTQASRICSKYFNLHYQLELHSQ